MSSPKADKSSVSLIGPIVLRLPAEGKQSFSLPINAHFRHYRLPGLGCGRNAFSARNGSPP